MIKNYFKIAWRNIIKSPFYSFVNITGLSAGIAFTLIIATYIWSESEVNSGLKNADRQYILQSKWKDKNQGIELTTLGPLAKALKEEYPNLVANYYRWDGVTSNVTKGDKAFREGLQICDSTMFKMYGFTLLHGDVNTAFDGPYSLVITTDRAMKYFGKTDVVGETLSIESFSGTKHDFMITGVMKRPFKNSATWLNEANDNQLYISSSNIGYFGRTIENWQHQYIVGYIELQKGVKPEDLNIPMQQLVKRNAAPQIVANMTPFLVPLKEYYLSANNGLIKKMLYALSGIAFFILLMAVINFINLSISRSASRMREIGIRKVLGGLKKQLILQFLTESVLLVFFATIAAIIIAVVARPLFNNILGKEIPALNSFPVYFVVFPLLLILIVGITAGLYPALVLSSMKSIDSLKGRLSKIGDKVILRKSLVAIQFGTATIVFIGAIIISKQVNLFFNKELGFNKDFIVSVQLPRNWTLDGVKKMEALRKQFGVLPQVSAATLSFEVPDGNNSGSVALYRLGSDSTTAISSLAITTDEYYASTFQIPIVAGDFFAKPGAFTDSLRLVINETHAKALGWNNPEDAIGKQVRFQSRSSTFTIAGVAKDFHFGSLQQTIQPVTFIHVGVNNIFRVMSFKLKPGNISSSIAALQKQWSVSFPGIPFEFRFMDETLAKLYTTEIQLKKASYTATFLSVMIVLLGVIGLIALSIQKRTKEIGIRKVLGSSVAGIVTLFIKEFVIIILTAGLIACPLAWLIMSNWLNAYAYRIDLTASPFIFSIVMLGLITGLLICLQTIKVALANPSKSLRTE